MSKDKNYNRLIQSPRWRTLRNAYLSEHPLCEECKARGYVRAANCVHHITPCETGRNEQEMEQLMFSPTNLRALCLDCHAAIHKAERSHSRAAVEQRQAERLARWIEARRKHNAADQTGRGTFLYEGV